MTDHFEENWCVWFSTFSLEIKSPLEGILNSALLLRGRPVRAVLLEAKEAHLIVAFSTKVFLCL